MHPLSEVTNRFTDSGDGPPDTGPAIPTSFGETDIFLEVHYIDAETGTHEVDNLNTIPIHFFKADGTAGSVQDLLPSHLSVNTFIESVLGIIAWPQPLKLGSFELSFTFTGREQCIPMKTEAAFQNAVALLHLSSSQREGLSNGQDLVLRVWQPTRAACLQPEQAKAAAVSRQRECHPASSLANSPDLATRLARHRDNLGSGGPSIAGPSKSGMPDRDSARPGKSYSK